MNIASSSLVIHACFFRKAFPSAVYNSIVALKKGSIRVCLFLNSCFHMFLFFVGVTKHLLLFFSPASLLLSLHSSFCFVFFCLIRHLSPLKLQNWSDVYQYLIIRSGCIMSMAAPCTLCSTWDKLKQLPGSESVCESWQMLLLPRRAESRGTTLAAHEGARTVAEARDCPVCQKRD